MFFYLWGVLMQITSPPAMAKKIDSRDSVISVTRDLLNVSYYHNCLHTFVIEYMANALYGDTSWNWILHPML